MNPRRPSERLRELLADARLAREAGDWSQLRALARAILTLDPGNAEAEALLAGAAERRQMTLMFCDVVGSTAMADARDPEELSAILRDYHTTCAQVVERFGGFVDDHQGDGMLVRFGYPEVHEDDARRAVLGGLEMVRAVRGRARTLREEHGIELHIRLAVHTDLVVLDGVGVVGATANEVARLQDLAQPDTVVISGATQALVRGHFDLEPMGEVHLRGVSRPVAVFTVLGERDAGHLEAGASLSPFAGRRAELERIAALWRDSCEDWQRALAGDSGAPCRALAVSGGPGIGKSRLVTEAARTLGAPVTECRCSSYHETTSLFPFTRVLEQACGIDETDGAERRLAKLRARLGDQPDLPFLAAALQIPSSALSPPAIDPRKLRDMAVVAAAGLVRSHASDGPSMLFVDDLHWADQSTLDLISLLLQDPRPGLLILLAARDGFEPPWPPAALERAQLGPLPGPALDEMSRLMPEGSSLSDEQRNDLISRSDGVPLFLEELVRTADALDQGHALHRSIRLADYAIPPALHDPLLARLALPGVDVALAQTAATIGRDVDRELLRKVAGLREEEFGARLETLVGAGLVDPWGDGGIRFRHELIREVAYETQRRSARRERHSRVADELLRGGGELRPGDAGEAAFHLDRAQRYDEAIEALVTAAQADQRLGAHTEATRRLTQALRLLLRLPEGTARKQTELGVRQLRSFSAVMAGGYSAPEAAEDHPRCVELCEELGLAPDLMPSLIRSWSYYTFRGDLAEADRVIDTMERGPRTGGPRFPLATVGRGLVGFFRGRFPEARRALEAFVAHPWAGTERQPPSTWPLPNDPLACVCAHLVPILWIGGEREEADAMAERALGRAEALSFPYGPFSVGYVTSLLAMTRRLEGDHAGAARLARAMIEAGERHGFVLWTIAGVIQRGLSRFHAGDWSGLEELVETVATWRRRLVAEVWTPYWLTELAVAEGIAGREKDALRSLDTALAVAADTRSDFYSAETLRIRGEMRHERGDPGGLSDIRAALAKSHRQEARAFELRAAMSLARATSGSPSAREALDTAIGRFSRDAHHHELDEARSLAAR